MKQIIFSIILFLVANLMFAQVTDTTKTRTKTTKTTTITTTTIITEDAADSTKVKPVKKMKKKVKKEVKETTTEHKNILKTNMTSFFISTFHLNYERVMNKQVTLQLGVHYSFAGSGLSDNGNNNNNSYQGIRGFGITPEIRFYPNKIAPIGFYVAFSPRFQSYTTSNQYYNNQIGGNSSTQVRHTAVGAGFLVGSQWIIGDRITIESYIGPSINYTNITSTNSLNNYSNNNGPIVNRVGVRFGVTLGVAF